MHRCLTKDNNCSACLAVVKAVVHGSTFKILSYYLRVRVTYVVLFICHPTNKLYKLQTNTFSSVAIDTKNSSAK